MPFFPGSLAQDVKGGTDQFPQSIRVKLPAPLDLIQGVEQAPADAACTVRPDRIDGDPFEAVQQHGDQFFVSEGVAH